MKDYFIGFCLLFVVPSVVEFWRVIIYLEKSKQINLHNLYDKRSDKKENNVDK